MKKHNVKKSMNRRLLTEMQRKELLSLDGRTCDDSMESVAWMYKA